LVRKGKVTRNRENKLVCLSFTKPFTNCIKSEQAGTAYVRDLQTGLSIILLTNRDANFGPHPFKLAHVIAKIADPTFPSF
jgi:hypothetical protein